MKIVEITEEEYQKFSEAQGHFLNSVEWASFRTNIRWQYLIIGLKDKESLKAAAIIHLKKVKYINAYYGYNPRGFIIDYSNQLLLVEFLKLLKEFLKVKKLFIFKTDPDILRYNVDLNFKQIPPFESNDIFNAFIDNEFNHCGFTNHFEGLQPRHTFRIPITDSDTIYNNMDKKTRNALKVGHKKGLSFEQGGVEDIPKFMKLLIETGERDGFTFRNACYYENILKVFKNNARLEFAKICPEKVIDNLYHDNLLLEKELFKVDFNLKNEKLSDKKKLKLNNKQVELVSRISKNNKGIEELKDFNQNEDIYIGASFSIFSNNRCWYVYGATSDSFREFMPAYALVDEMIKECLKRNVEYFDMFGVGGVVSQEDKYYGLYLFKKGFGGNPYEFIGEFDLILNKFYYLLFEKLYPFLKRIKK